jgi:hypothetical protein
MVIVVSLLRAYGAAEHRDDSEAEKQTLGRIHDSLLFGFRSSSAFSERAVEKSLYV